MRGFLGALVAGLLAGCGAALEEQAATDVYAQALPPCQQGCQTSYEHCRDANEQTDEWCYAWRFECWERCNEEGATASPDTDEAPAATASGHLPGAPACWKVSGECYRIGQTQPCNGWDGQVYQCTCVEIDGWVCPSY